MLMKFTLRRISFLLKRKEAVCVCYIFLIMVIANFIGNVREFRGTDLVEMYHPMKLLLLSYDRTNHDANNTALLTMLYPLLVVCPAGFALASEHRSRSDILLISRLGKGRYYLGSFIAVFFVTVVTVTVPFLLEIVLNCLSFPLSAEGDLYNLPYFDSFYIERVNNYFSTGLFIFSPYLYAVVYILVFGIFSGLLGVVTAALSVLFDFKYNIFLILPVFLALELSALVDNAVFDGQAHIKWYEYVLIFSDEPKNVAFMTTEFAVLILITVFAAFFKSRRDCLA